MTIHVTLVDSQLLVAMGIRQLLEAEDDIHVMDVRTDCHIPCDQGCMQASPDVLLMETVLDQVSALDCIRRVINKQPSARILALGHDACTVTAQHALSLGATGYLCKQAPPGELLTAVRSVASGQKYVCPKAGRHLLTSPSFESNRFQELTRREYEIMLLMVDGHSASEISQVLSISTKTLANHHTHILRKLEVRNLVDLTRLAIRHGIIQAGLLLGYMIPELPLLL